MKYRKILIVVLLIILSIAISFSNVCCYGYYFGDTEYVWSENTVETSSGENTVDFLDLSCESAILIEQTTRKSFI